MYNLAISLRRQYWTVMDVIEQTDASVQFDRRILI